MCFTSRGHYCAITADKNCGLLVLGQICFLSHLFHMRLNDNDILLNLKAHDFSSIISA